MVIGVDAGALAEQDERLKVGIYRVTYELLKQLSKLDPINTYRLYSYAPIPGSVMKEFGNNMVNNACHTSCGYMRVQLPMKLILQPVNLFLGVAQAVPFGVRTAIGFIYDLGFLHHPEVYGKQAAALKKQTEALVARSSHIITISEAVKCDIRETFGIISGRITVSYPGVSEVFVKNKEKMRNPNTYFLTVGLLKPGKNIPVAIRAFAHFLKRIGKSYELIIIGGDTELDPEIQKTISALHLHKQVRVLGYVADEEVAKWYRGAVGLFALSVTEGFCLPAVEALVSGCPVIYAESGALPEIVGEAGISVSVSDEQSIVAAMTAMTKRRIETVKQAARYQWISFAEKVYDRICRYSDAQ